MTGRVKGDGGRRDGEGGMSEENRFGEIGMDGGGEHSRNQRDDE